MDGMDCVKTVVLSSVLTSAAGRKPASRLYVGWVWIDLIYLLLLLLIVYKTVPRLTSTILYGIGYVGKI